MRLPFDQFHTVLGTATKVLFAICVACLGIAFGFALLGFSDVVVEVQEWTLKAAIASAVAFSLLIIAWVSGELARRIEGSAGARPQ